MGGRALVETKRRRVETRTKATTMARSRARWREEQEAGITDLGTPDVSCSPVRGEPLSDPDEEERDLDGKAEKDGNEYLAGRTVSRMAE